MGNCQLHMNLHYNGLTVQALSSDSSDLTWLREFLCPFFITSGDETYDCRVALIRDDQRFEEALKRGPRADGAEINCFALDTTCVRLPLWNALDGQMLLFDEECQAFYLANHDKTKIEIFTRRVNRSARIALMRVIREFAMTHSHLRGGLFIHGAAFSVDGRCVIVAGPKRAGKTTLLTYALRSKGARFVSNDRVLVLLEKSKVVGRGMPTIVTIRKEGLEMFPDLCRRIETTAYDCTLSLNERAHRATHVDEENRFSLSPAQFCEFLQVSASAQGEVGALIFPRVRANKRSLKLESLPLELAFGRLKEALFRSNFPQKTANLFRLENVRDSEEEFLDKQCLRLISRIPCFDCHLRPDTYADQASAGALFDLARGELRSTTPNPAAPKAALSS